MEAITFVHEEEINEESHSYQVVSFPIDPMRLIQENDGIDDEVDGVNNDDESGSSDEESDNDDEPELISVAPDFMNSSSIVNSVQSEVASGSMVLASRPKPLKKNAPHSKDIMQRSLVLRAAGMSYVQINELLGVPVSTMQDHKKRYRDRKGNADPIRRKKKDPSMKITEAGSAFLVQTVTTHNTLTLQQIQQLYYKEFGHLLVLSTFYRHLVYKCGFTIKRAHFFPERRNDETTKEDRVNFIRDYIISGEITYDRNCVFVDEASVTANMTRNYAWALSGLPALVKKKHLYARTRTMLAAVSHFGIVEVCLKVNKPGTGGGTKTRDFYAFLQRLMDKLDQRNLQHKNWNIVCDNAPIHTAHYIRDMVAERGYRLVYLPKYSPFLNPIEMMFSKVKLKFRHDTTVYNLAHTLEGQTEDMEDRLKLALAQVTVNDCNSWIQYSIKHFHPCLIRVDNL